MLVSIGEVEVHLQSPSAKSILADGLGPSAKSVLPSKPNQSILRLSAHNFYMEKCLIILKSTVFCGIGYGPVCRQPSRGRHVALT